jgi:hypothetical protein
MGGFEASYSFFLNAAMMKGGAIGRQGHPARLSHAGIQSTISTNGACYSSSERLITPWHR